MTTEPVFQISRVKGRKNLGGLMTRHGLNGEAVEVGTHQGMFAKELLTNWESGVLHCIDPWSVPPGYERQASILSPSKGKDREGDMRATRNSLRSWISAGRCKIHRMLSTQAMGMFQDNSLDMVYVDGDHGAEAVREDLFGWWPKIRPGGLLAGHDVLCPGAGDRATSWAHNIQPALRALCSSAGVGIMYLLMEPQGNWSFYVWKPRPEGKSEREKGGG